MNQYDGVRVIKAHGPNCSAEKWDVDSYHGDTDGMPVAWTAEGTMRLWIQLRCESCNEAEIIVDARDFAADLMRKAEGR